jgi:hypothetical protein
MSSETVVVPAPYPYLLSQAPPSPPRAPFLCPPQTDPNQLSPPFLPKISQLSISISDEQTYAWRPPDAPEESTCYFDVGELVRFRVESEEWHDHAPTGPTQSQKAKERLQQQREHQRRNGQVGSGHDVAAGETTGEIERRAPYVVIVSFSPFLSIIHSPSLHRCSWLWISEVATTDHS